MSGLIVGIFVGNLLAQLMLGLWANHLRPGERPLSSFVIEGLVKSILASILAWIIIGAFHLHL